MNTCARCGVSSKDTELRNYAANPDMTRRILCEGCAKIPTERIAGEGVPITVKWHDTPPVEISR
jgi:hypothetical protein